MKRYVWTMPSLFAAVPRIFGVAAVVVVAACGGTRAGDGVQPADAASSVDAAGSPSVDASSPNDATADVDARAASGIWTEAPKVPDMRDEAAAANVEGHLYYLGGFTARPAGPGTVVSDLVDIYDPVAGTWSAGPPLPVGSPRHHLATAVIGTSLYVLGGFTGPSGQFLGSAQTWVLAAGAWSRLADQPVARGAAAVQVVGTKIFVAGGGPNEGASVADVYAYDPAADAWTTRASLQAARQHVGSCATQGGMIVLGGWVGGSATGILGVAESYDAATDSWSTLARMPTARAGLEAITLNGLCYALGGEGIVAQVYDTTPVNESFDVVSGMWTTQAPMPTKRHGFGVAAIGGFIYAVGGAPEPSDSFTNVMEIFVPQ